MKSLFHFFIAILLFSSRLPCFAQEEHKTPPTNFDEFVSKHGGFVQIEDFPLQRMILELSYAGTHIRKVVAGGETKIYYQVESGDYYGSVASDDYPALMDAYAKLQSQALEEKKNTHDYFVNKYVDRGGLEIGYIVDKKRLTWFMKPHRFGSRVLMLKDATTLQNSLTEGADVIQKLKR